MPALLRVAGPERCPAAALAPGETPSTTYLAQLPQPARRVCGGRRRCTLLLPFTFPSLTQGHRSARFPRGLGQRRPAAGRQRPPGHRDSLPPHPAPSPCGRRGGQLLQHGLGQQLPLLRGGDGKRAVSGRLPPIPPPPSRVDEAAAVPSAPRRAAGAAAASPSAAPGACGRAGKSRPQRARGAG